ncbi:polysaccharide biosynthesis/export family protein [Belnapia sp. T6]|uniref:Polysaccharide biosynthesis/export family protein n=1 Tax=Belnapia mucosa TaxID=2804532 RepID=A0ABS1VBR5_9PROT|nr:polysaccharide biosynthesis/export family protein [Belnapia mucosa]MBL6459078.1 polysaccharide biosynthesis/export family protein [Belnapia mucosa]
MALALTCGIAPVSAQAEYMVGVGDVLDLRVTGVPDLSRRMAVDPDGSVLLPGAGRIQVAGLTAMAMRSRIELAMASQVFRQKDRNDRLRLVALKPGDVVVGVVEYRPVYVDGDVLTTGQYAYRPSMTVRQVVALSGGYSLLRGRQSDLFRDRFELLSHYRGVGAQLAKEQVRAARLQAELENREELPTIHFDELPISEADGREMVRDELEALRVSQAEYRQAQAVLTSAIDRITAHTRVLADAQQREEQEVRANQADFERTTKLFGSGSLPSQRVTETRHAVMEAAARRLGLLTEMIKAQADGDELQRKLEKLANDRRVRLLEDIGASRVRLVEFRAKLEATGAHLGRGAEARQFQRLGQTVQPELSVVRQNGAQTLRIEVTEDTDLEPGDVLDVRFPTAQALLLTPTAAGQRSLPTGAPTP